MLVISAFAQEAGTNAPAAQPSTTNGPAAAVVTLLASSATLTAPFVLTNDIISQPEITDLAGGGKAVFNFSVTHDDDYLVCVVVNAPDEGSNSVYVNVDAAPEDPAMIWDIEVADGFAERTVGWRGNGSAESDEIAPKIFHLAAGEHKLIIVGREPAGIKTIGIKPKAK
jgi:hypothetical protein